MTALQSTCLSHLLSLFLAKKEQFSIQGAACFNDNTAEAVFQLMLILLAGYGRAGRTKGAVCINSTVSMNCTKVITVPTLPTSLQQRLVNLHVVGGVYE